jgi:hypothetical protein
MSQALAIVTILFLDRLAVSRGLAIRQRLNHVKRRKPLLMGEEKSVQDAAKLLQRHSDTLYRALDGTTGTTDTLQISIL